MKIQSIHTTLEFVNGDYGPPLSLTCRIASPSKMAFPFGGMDSVSLSANIKSGELLVLTFRFPFGAMLISPMTALFLSRISRP